VPCTRAGSSSREGGGHRLMYFPSSRGGFSLFEMLISLFILTVAIHAIAASALSILGAERAAKSRSEATLIFNTLCTRHWSGDRIEKDARLGMLLFRAEDILGPDKGPPHWKKYTPVSASPGGGAVPSFSFITTDGFQEAVKRSRLPAATTTR